jgi:hypothetical protein
MRVEHVRDDWSKYVVDDIAYWEENVTLGVDIVPDYLLDYKFYDPEQDIWIDAVEIGDQYIADPAKNPSSKTFIPLSLQNVNAFASVALNAIPLENGGQQVFPPLPSTA